MDRSYVNRQKECTADRKNVQQTERMYNGQKECTANRKNVKQTEIMSNGQKECTADRKNVQQTKRMYNGQKEKKLTTGRRVENRYKGQRGNVSGRTSEK